MMVLDKQTVLSLLDKKNEHYDSYVIAVNLAPDDTLFEVVIEDTVTAEFYDASNDKMSRVVLDYDYFNSKDTYLSYEERKVDREIYESLDEERKAIGGGNSVLIFGLISTTLLVILIVCIVIFYISIR